uniref:Uncharacterized protein n=2 Tax=Palpitomonas bilix TaxID=652834 RepID=A0A7S3GM75_9EUKA|mmetsp:Transcript_9365/g.25445  ORF Transcript_9365/g.25445 Transcript_9365/m.25445 type:complete len:140 (+) Transcript_9365:172-591(+)
MGGGQLAPPSSLFSSQGEAGGMNTGGGAFAHSPASFGSAASGVGVQGNMGGNQLAPPSSFFSPQAQAGGGASALSPPSFGNVAGGGGPTVGAGVGGSQVSNNNGSLNLLDISVKLTSEDEQAYRAPRFEKGKVPIHPPS